MEYNNGNLTAINTYLKGNEDYFLELETKTKRKIDIRGKVNVVLASFLLPFARDVRGNLNINSSLLLNPDNVELYGKANLDSGYAKIDDFPMAIEHAAMDANFSHKYIQINNFHSNFGGGNLKGTGTIRFEGIKNIPIKIESVLEKANLQVNQGSSLLSSGNISIDGNWFPYKLRGDVYIRNGSISPDEESNKNIITKSNLLPDIVQKNTFTPLVTDLKIHITGNQVRIVHPFIKTAIQGELSVKGDITAPFVSGEINQATKGTLLFNEAEFIIDSMNVSFPPDNKINPDIYLTANTRWKEYDINMIATGTLNDPRVNFTSQPPLNEGDIITLLTLGYTQDSLEQDVSVESSDSRAYEIGTAIINKNPLNKQIEDKTGIVFKFNTATDSANENITVPKVEISKKWGSKLETKAGRTFGKILKNDAKVEYKINNKVSVVGSWEGESYNENSDITEVVNEDVFGLDLEYKVEFK